MSKANMQDAAIKLVLEHRKQRAVESVIEVTVGKGLWVVEVRECESAEDARMTRKMMLAGATHAVSTLDKINELLGGDLNIPKQTDELLKRIELLTQLLLVAGKSASLMSPREWRSIAREERSRNRAIAAAQASMGLPVGMEEPGHGG